MLLILRDYNKNKSFMIHSIHSFGPIHLHSGGAQHYCLCEDLRQIQNEISLRAIKMKATFHIKTHPLERMKNSNSLLGIHR